MSPLDEIVPGLWRWSVARNGVPPTMTAYVLSDGEDTILVDPLVAGETEPLLAVLDEIVRGRVRILVTTLFHVRGSGLLSPWPSATRCSRSTESCADAQL